MTCWRLTLCIAILLSGCAHRRSQTVTESVSPPEATSSPELAESPTSESEDHGDITPTAFEDSEEADFDPEVTPPELVPEADSEDSTGEEGGLPPIDGPLLLEDVIDSVYRSYPLLESALYSRNIASGEQLAASGGFDLKVKGASENGPTGFYRTYRQSIGVIQPLYHGGEVFGGYRVGRGDFEPWYKERQTNDGGEFKAGLSVPLARNKEIDERRAALWRAGYGRQLVEPDIQAQLIGFVQEAAYAYWDWVAAGEQYQIADRVLQLAVDRTEGIEMQVELEFEDPPVLTDNLRLVAERRAKLADAERKFRQKAVKLSLYYRSFDGRPLIPQPEDLPSFPDPMLVTAETMASDIPSALQQRPEIRVLNFMRRQLDVDLASAQNDLRPNLDAVVTGSQDVGRPTSSKNDKGEFELDASLFLDVPLQRRKAQGKIRAIEGKMAQLGAKRRLTEDKIVTDVQTAYAGLISAYEQVEQATLSVELAEEVAAQERLSFQEGASDLLKVAIREQYAAEAALKVVDALLLYYLSAADYRAALAQDRLP